MDKKFVEKLALQLLKKGGIEERIQSTIVNLFGVYIKEIKNVYNTDYTFYLKKFYLKNHFLLYISFDIDRDTNEKRVMINLDETWLNSKYGKEFKLSDWEDILRYLQQLHKQYLQYLQDTETMKTLPKTDLFNSPSKLSIDELFSNEDLYEALKQAILSRIKSEGNQHLEKMYDNTRKWTSFLENNLMTDMYFILAKTRYIIYKQPLRKQCENKINNWLINNWNMVIQEFKNLINTTFEDPTL